MIGKAAKALDIHSGSLILVNSGHPFLWDVEDTELTPVTENSDVLLEREPAQMLNRLMGELNGWKGIVPVSGRRSNEEQRELWDKSMEENGADFTKQFVAPPGCSEHETGLAIDLGLMGGDIDFIRPSFPDIGLCGRFRRRAAQYGFVERYPSGKEALTGIAHEPWHFRYVGRPHAELMERKGLVLEEYIDFIRYFPLGDKPFVFESGGEQWKISFLPGGTDIMKFEGDGVCQISGNNVDGFIVTVRARP